jgi:hypothetical protein
VEPLDAVLTDTLQAHIEVAEQALAMEDPWEGFAFYLKETCRLQATDRGLNDAMGTRFPRATALEDLALVTWANTRILQASRAAAPPTPGGGTWASCWTASAPSGPPRSRSRRCHRGRCTGPCSPSAAAPPGAATSTPSITAAVSPARVGACGVYRLAGSERA